MMMSLILPQTRGSRKENAGSRAKTRRRCANSPGRPNRAGRWFRSAGLLGIAFVTLGGGGNIGNLTLPGGPDAAFAQFSHYEPYVVVDVADLADPTAESDLAETEVGELMDVNEELFACGWYEDDNPYELPFFVSPLDGGTAYTLPMTDGVNTYDEGHAIALAETTGYDIDGLKIVGWVDDYSPGPQAAYWVNDGGGAGDWELVIIDEFNGATARALDINADGDLVVGSWYDSSEGAVRPFDTDLDTTTHLWTNIEGEVAGVYSDDVLAGTRTNRTASPNPAAFHYDIPTTTITYLEHEYGVSSDEYEETYGVAVNGFNDVVGYGYDDDYSITDGVLWYSDGNGSWDLVRLDQDNPDPVDSTLTDVSDKASGTVDIVGTYTSGGAFYVTVSPTGSYSSYSLDAVTSGGYAHDSFVLFPLRIRQQVEDNSWTPETYSANGINGIATIAGSYKDGAPSNEAIRPCLFVANDMNNNGEPDLREILQADLDGTTDLDLNGNWMLDGAEQMRVGLHTPGAANGPDGGLDPVQIVRFKINIKPRGEDPTEEIEDEDFIDEFVDPANPECAACEDFTDRINDWGHGDARSNDEPSEILIRVHSMMGDEATWGNYEGLPADATTETEALEDIRSFSFRFAHCLDWLQWGNESFGGAEGYKIRDDADLSGGCTWNGPAKILSDLASDSCKEEAAALILKWQGEQMDAARIGSALAGRPLRMASCGISSNSVNSGYDSDNLNRYLVTSVSDWCNAHRAYFDMHLHYQTVEQAEHAINKLINTHSVGSAPWTVPDGRIAAEVGVRADGVDDDWWGEGDPTHAVVHNQFFFTGIGDPPENYYWEDFVDDWESESDNWNPQGEDPGFRLDDVFGWFEGADFNAICYSAQQFGVGTTMDPSPYLVGAMRATKLREDEFTEDPDRFTPLKSAYLSATSTHSLKIQNFDPHPSTCSYTHTCPDCQ